MNKYLKPIGIYVLIFVVILAALAYTGPQILPQRNDAAQEEYVYSDLLKELDENNVASVEVSRRTEVGDYGICRDPIGNGTPAEGRQCHPCGCAEYIRIAAGAG